MQKSADQAADPDRHYVEYFEKGGDKPSSSKVELLNQSTDGQSATFAIWEEGHTLGNALRHLIMQNPEVDLCGYSIPHPSEDKLHLRIQGKTAAIDILRKGLDDLIQVTEHAKSKFLEQMEAGEYEVIEDEE